MVLLDFIIFSQIRGTSHEHSSGCINFQFSESTKFHIRCYNLASLNLLICRKKLLSKIPQEGFGSPLGDTSNDNRAFKMAVPLGVHVDQDTAVFRELIEIDTDMKTEF